MGKVKKWKRLGFSCLIRKEEISRAEGKFFNSILSISAHLLNSYSVLWATGIDRHRPAEEDSRTEVMKGRL